MNGFIYKITNEVNNKVYIGKTLSSIDKRFKQHKEDSQKENEEIRPLYRAMKKYGVEKFHIEKVEECPLELLSEREKYWINYFSSYTNGYNATLGGEGKQLYDYDKIVKEFLSGKLIYELANEFNCCPDTICQALKLSNIDPNSNASQKSKKSIIAKNLSGEIIQKFDSRTEAVKWLQQNNYVANTVDKDNVIATIGRVANGKRKSAYGLIWENN